ncbi:MAG: hypothetical protein AABX61_02015 [Nanoarchaeota archaeon]
MEIIKDDRKKQLFKILEHMYTAIKENKLDVFYDLNLTYTKSLLEIFGYKYKGDSEGFEWDAARNLLMAIYTISNSKNKEKFKEFIEKNLIESLKRIENLKRFLI